MTDEKNTSDDKIFEAVASMASALASQYNETTNMLYAALEQNGVEKADIEAIIDRVPGIALNLDKVDTSKDIEAHRKGMETLDLILVGLLFHENRGLFIAEKEKGSE
jgi:vancomycin permeability regulator SanA